MKPTVPHVAGELARRLRTEILPELTGFPANVVGMGAELIDMIGQQWDSAAANLVAENRAFRAVLARGGALLGDAALTAAGQGADEDLRISALTAQNDRLRAALIPLHARIEDTPGDDARALEDAIWSALRDSVQARQIASANF